MTGWRDRTGRRRGRRWQDTGEDDHFAGDPYFARWLDETDPGDPDADLWPKRRRRELVSDGMDTPLWWRIWRWWR